MFVLIRILILDARPGLRREARRDKTGETGAQDRLAIITQPAGMGLGVVMPICNAPIVPMYVSRSGFARSG